MLESFESYHFPPFIIAVILLISSLVIFQFRKNWGILFLVLGSLSMAFFMANLDPFLNTWDEQQHALVAKNMTIHPFKPMLYSNPVLDYNHKIWTGNHIWLHKQPLFLWQMAASMKLFGVNVLAMRLPSVLMQAAMPYLIYRIGKIAMNEQTGFFAGFLFALMHFPLELVAGRYATDHNDVAFMFYTTWSIMCLFEYQHSKQRKWLILLGISAGCAVLVKWLTGLFVYLIAYVIQLTESKFKFWRIKDFMYLLLPFCISLIVFVPWQIYIFNQFPIEAESEFSAVSSHFFAAVEGHGGDWTYHLTIGIDQLYNSGLFIKLLLIATFIIGLWRIQKLEHRLSLALGVIFIYLFFSMASTKMLGFTLIVMPIVLLLIAATFDFAVIISQKHFKRLGKWMIICSLGALGFLFLNFKQIGKNHAPGITFENAGRENELKELKIIHELKREFDNDSKVVIFNSGITSTGYIEYMFFTNYTSYSFIPTKNQINKLAQEGYKIVILDRNNLSEDLRNNDIIQLFKI